MHAPRNVPAKQEGFGVQEAGPVKKALGEIALAVVIMVFVVSLNYFLAHSEQTHWYIVAFFEGLSKERLPWIVVVAYELAGLSLYLGSSSYWD